MHMQFGFAFFVGEDCSYAAAFMDAPQKGHHGFGGHGVSVFWSNDNFALVLSAAEEEAERAFYFFFCCEFLYDFMESFAVVES